MLKRKSKIRDISKEELTLFVKQATSLSDILRSMELSIGTGNFHSLRKRLEDDEIDYQHVKLCLTNNGRWVTAKRPLSEVLVENSDYSRFNLKKRLIKEGLLEIKCSKCGLETMWFGEPIVLVLDHINGIHNDNRLCNLRLLCPNCNSQTETFAGRANKKHKCICSSCGGKTSRKATLCHNCNKRRPKLSRRKVVRPSKEELSKLLWEEPTSKLAHRFGVSGKAIEKWAKSYGITKPSRGYWAKKYSEDSKLLSSTAP